MKISINTLTDVRIEGDSAEEEITRTLGGSSLSKAQKSFLRGDESSYEKQFMIDGYIYEYTELVLEDQYLKEYKVYNKGELMVVVDTASNSHNVWVYRKKAMLDKLDPAQLTPIYKEDKFPSFNTYTAENGDIVKQKFTSEYWAMQKLTALYLVEDIYSSAGIHKVRNTTQWITYPYDRNDVSNVNKYDYEDQDADFENDELDENNKIILKSHFKRRVATLIDGRYYELVSDELLPYNDDGMAEGEVHNARTNDKFNSVWELAIDSNGKPLKPYFLVGAGNNKSISDKSLLTYTTGTDLYIPAYGKCFNKVAILRSQFKEICIEARDIKGHIIPVKGKSCRKIEDEKRSAYADMICPECDNLPLQPDCVDDDDRYDVIFELENYNADNVMIRTVGDASIGGVFLGRTYELNCLMWGVQIRPITTSTIEKDERTGAISRIEGVSKRVINFPLRFPTGFTDAHSRFFSKYISDLVLIEGTPRDGITDADKIYFSTLNLFAYIVDAPITLANKSRSDASLKVEEVLKWD